MELVKQRIHKQIPHQPTKATQTQTTTCYSPAEEKCNRMISGTPDKTEWYVDKIVSHCWKGRNIEFLVKWKPRGFHMGACIQLQ